VMAQSDPRTFVGAASNSAEQPGFPPKDGVRQSRATLAAERPRAVGAERLLNSSCVPT
jgi:hypothetical protein